MACGAIAFSTDGLKAVIVRPDYTLKTIDSTGSIGTWIRAVVKRKGVTVHTTTPELNTGVNQIAYNTELSNGDQLIVQTSNGDRFFNREFVEDAKWIPSPNLAFAPI